MKLDGALRECTLALLRRIAAHHGIPAGDEVTRLELVARIAERYSDEQYLRGFASNLPADELEVLRYVAGHGWEGRGFLLERQFPAGPGLPSPCLSLLQKGVLFRGFGAVDRWRGEIYHVPEEVSLAIASVLPAGESRRTLPVPAFRGTVFPESGRDAPFDLFCLLSLLSRSDRRSAQGGLSRQDLARLGQEAGGPDQAPEDAASKWRFLLRLCLGAGWIWRDGPFLRPGRSVGRVLAGTRSAVAQRLLDRYLKDRNWSDLAEAGKVRQSIGNRGIDEAAGRQILLHYLREFATTDWVSEDAFLEAVRATNPDFLREDYSSLAWAMIDTASQAEVYGEDSWRLVEAEWIRYVIRGPLEWLGAVRWARDAEGRRVALRFAGPSADLPPSALLGQSEQPIQFLQDMSVLAQAGCDLGILYRLEPYMVYRGTEATARRYRFTIASVHHGLEVGGSWPELRELVEGASGGRLPEGVVPRLQEWAASYGRLVLEGSVLLTAATEEELSEIERIPGVAECLGDRIGSRSARVVPRHQWRLLSILREAGRPPRVEPSAGNLRLRGATGDQALLRESLFAILLLRSLHGRTELEDANAAQRTLEAALGPEDSEEVSRRAHDAARRLRGRGESGW